ncbi:MAG: DUF2007 domain-containing protein [Pseudomonadota bacterium]
MEEILRTNDPALLSFAMAILSGEDIEAVVFDVHMSVMEGSIGVFPKRLMVASEDAVAARSILNDHELETTPPA